MPVLREPSFGEVAPGPDSPPGSAHLPIFSRCANPHCPMGWMHLWRSRGAPRFEGKWSCSPHCLQALVAAAVRREGAPEPAAAYSHRLPMGLLLVEQGRLTHRELVDALDSCERASAHSGTPIRLGAWLMERGVLDEASLTRVLSAQWRCPVFSLEAFRPSEVVSALPQFLAESFGAVPLHRTGSEPLYLAYADKIDRTVNYAIERILGIRVAAGLVRDSEFRAAQSGFLRERAPAVKMIEASGARTLARSFAYLVEREKAADAGLVRIHDTWWMRIWKRTRAGIGLPAIGDVVDVLSVADAQFSDLS
jgi:Type II secretion system (T2SS), protein E, N-terminal domain